MSSVNNNYRFFSLASLGILVLFLSTPTDVFAYKEEQVRTTNNRLWSIIEGKVEFDKSSYSLEKVRVSTPKPEQFQPTPQTKYERITSRQLQNMQFIPNNLKKDSSARKVANHLRQTQKVVLNPFMKTLML